MIKVDVRMNSLEAKACCGGASTLDKALEILDVYYEKPFRDAVSQNFLSLIVFSLQKDAHLTEPVLISKLNNLTFNRSRLMLDNICICVV